MDKAAWRHTLTANRRGLPDSVRATEAARLAGHVAALDIGDTVCGYLPMRTEPGDTAMLDALRHNGIRVLLPVIDVGSPLDWAPYLGPDHLRAAQFGVTEPVAPRLGSAALRTATAVLVPALAVDHDGVRLGKGGGFYDRSLPTVRPDCRLIAVVRDDEVVTELPSEDHDVRMTHALTPVAGLRAL